MHGWMNEFEIWARKDRVQAFPRCVGFERLQVGDEVELYDYMKMNRWIDCYSTIFARTSKFDTVLMDVDGHDGQGDLRLNNVLKKLNKAKLKFRLYATGRGYHVYVDFEPVKLNDYRHVMLTWFKKLGVSELIDLVASGSERRIARLPLTWNSKSGTLMERLNGSDGFNEKLSDELLSYDRERSEVHDYEKIKMKFDHDDDLPLCVKRGISLLKMSGELNHAWRFHIATFLLKVWDYDKVKDVFRSANDFSERVTDYQLRQILSRGYKCYSCKKLRMIGICDFADQKKCAFYDLTGGWLEVMTGDIE